MADDPILRWEWEGGAPEAPVTPRVQRGRPTARAERRGSGMFARPGAAAGPPGPEQAERPDDAHGSRSRRRGEPA